MSNQKINEINLMAQNIRDYKSINNKLEIDLHQINKENEELKSQLKYHLSENKSILDQSNAIKAELEEMEKSNGELVNNFKSTLNEINHDFNSQKLYFICYF